MKDYWHREKTKKIKKVQLARAIKEYDNVRVKRKVLQGLQDIHRQYNPRRTFAGLSLYGQPDV
jgi:hypothetical protein